MSSGEEASHRILVSASHLLIYVIGCACSVLHFCNACSEHDVPARGLDLHHPRIDNNNKKKY